MSPLAISRDTGTAATTAEIEPANYTVARYVPLLNATRTPRSITGYTSDRVSVRS